MTCPRFLYIGHIRKIFISYANISKYFKYFEIHFEENNTSGGITIPPATTLFFPIKNANKNLGRLCGCANVQLWGEPLHLSKK